METFPAVIVHSLGDAVAALARGAADGANVTFALRLRRGVVPGCGWWHALMESARAEYPNVPCVDILDCADGTGVAFAALRIGLSHLVLWPEAPGRDAVVAIAEAQAGFVLMTPPPANSVVAGSRANRGTVPITSGGRGLPSNDERER